MFCMQASCFMRAWTVYSLFQTGHHADCAISKLIDIQHNRYHPLPKGRQRRPTPAGSAAAATRNTSGTNASGPSDLFRSFVSPVQASLLRMSAGLTPDTCAFCSRVPPDIVRRLRMYSDDEDLVGQDLFQYYGATLQGPVTCAWGPARFHRICAILTPEVRCYTDVMLTEDEKHGDSAVGSAIGVNSANAFTNRNTYATLVTPAPVDSFTASDAAVSVPSYAAPAVTWYNVVRALERTVDIKVRIWAC